MVNQLMPILIKLGGSVITIKDKSFTPNTAIIRRMAEEISETCLKSIVIIHGGGSYGHPIAKEYNIREGYQNPEQLVGFSKTRQTMMELNKLVIDAFIEINLPVVSVQPSSFIFTEDGRIKEFDLTILKKLINLKMIPVLYGDAVLDTKRGFTILSGDQIISNLAVSLNVDKMVLCVDVDGLYSEDPKMNPKAKFIKRITLDEIRILLKNIGNSKAIDVTGGMYGKIVELIPALEKGVEVKMINATKANNIYKTLRNQDVKGTTIIRR
jgi:isopentenyl phosphate kinase